MALHDSLPTRSSQHSNISMVWVQVCESPRMPRREAWQGSKGVCSPSNTTLMASPESTARVARPSSPARLSRPGSPARQPLRAASLSDLSRQGSPQAKQLAKAASQGNLLAQTSRSTKQGRSVPGARLPREGASPGGGAMSAIEPGWMGKTLRATEDWQATPSKPTKPAHLSTSSSAGSLPENASRSDAGSPPKADFHKRALSTWQAGTSTSKSGPGLVAGLRHDILQKQDRVNALRERDQNRIRDKVGHGKQMREDRFQRMLEDTFSGSRPVLDAAMTLRRQEAQDEKRRCDLHTTWGDQVYKPLESQIEEHMNPADRAWQQTLAGSKSVGFYPAEPFKLTTHREDDPTWREISDHAWEETFDKEAAAVLYGLHSTSDLRASAQRDPSRGLCPAAAKSRPVLDPTKWGQLKLQGTLYGRFAQVCEEGPNARMGKRGGPDITAPCEADGVATAGKRSIRGGPRVTIHNDVGLLKRDGVAWNGESSLRKTWHGASSGAPLQDHYTYEMGAPVTDIEFPLGRRTFPQWP